MEEPEVGAFSGARAIEERFVPREEYNPFNREMFPRVFFAISTRDERERQPDT